MDTSKHRNIRAYPWWLILFYHPMVIFTAIMLLRDAWFIDKLAPPHVSSESSGLEFSMRLSGVCCIPLVCSILVVMGYRTIFPDMVSIYSGHTYSITLQRSQYSSHSSAKPPRVHISICDQSVGM